MRVLRLPRAKVSVGIPLPWNVRDEAGKLLLIKGHVVQDDHQLDLLLARGAYVDFEEVRGSEHPSGGPPISAVVVPPNLFGAWDKMPAQLQALIATIGLPDFSARLDLYVQHLLVLLDIHPDVALYRCVRQDNAQHYWYGYAHSVHTAVLCVLMARQLQWPVDRMQSLLKAALTMNISILDLQGQMAGQDVPMKDRQREKIHQHPMAAVQALTAAGVSDALWLGAVEQHHERSDGSGYPNGRSVVCEMAVALRVADVFMAKISPRALRDALTPQTAVRQLYSEDGGGPLSTSVVKQFGLFPPGDYVKLASGELAVVVQRTASAKAPIVAAITDAAGQAVAKTVRFDTASKAHAIVGTVLDKTLLKRLAPERLYGFIPVSQA